MCIYEKEGKWKPLTHRNIGDDDNIIDGDDDDNDKSRGKWSPLEKTNQRHASPQCGSYFDPVFGFETFDCYDEDDDNLADYPAMSF